MRGKINIYPFRGGRTTVADVAEHFGASPNYVHALLGKYDNDMERVAACLEERNAKQGRNLNQIRAERLAAERRQCDEIAQRLWGKRART